MSFRHVRKSRDGYTWLGLMLSVLAVVAVAISTFYTDPAIPRALSGVLFGLFFVGLVWFTRILLFPFEWELVVDGDQIRWGRADRPDKQERVVVSQLARLVHDKSDHQVLGDTGSWRLLHIGDGILIRSDDQRALVDYLRQSFPQLRIETT